MYTLHIANKNYSSWSLRPWVAMKMAGIAFEEKLHVFSAFDSNREEFEKFSPTALVPCLDHEGLIVWESLAILEYLADRHDGIWPSFTEPRAFARCAASEMHAGFFALRNNCPMSVGVRVTLPAINEALQTDLDRLDALWREGLNRFGGPFLAGETFTGVDAMFCPVAFRIMSYDLKLSEEGLAYGERLRALEPMQDWFRAGLAEPYREPGHDDEIAVLGTLTADLRASS